MLKWIGLISCICTACTFNVIQNHTEGNATDLIDETQDTQLNPNISVVHS